MAWLPDDQVLSTRESLAALMREFEFASCVLIGNAVSLADAARSRTGVQFRAAAYEAPAAHLLTRLAQLLQLDDPKALRYVDARRQCSRTLRIDRRDDQNMLAGFLLCGDASAGQWLGDVLKGELSTDPYGRMLLASGAKAPSVAPPRSRQVCACMNVGEQDIVHCLQHNLAGSDAQKLDGLKRQLGCGTGCGSCIPALKKLIGDVQPQAAAA